MTLFSNRILKAGTVEVDTDNKVVIEVAPLQEQGMPLTSEPERGSTDVEKIEAKARNIVQQARYQAEQILNEARRAAAVEQANLISQAEAEATRLTREASDRGYQEGMEVATREGDAIKAEATKVLEQANADREAMQKALEPEMVQLLIDIMDKLVGDAVKLNPSIIINLIKQGLSSSTITGDVIVYVSAQDFDETIAKKDELLAITDGSVKLDIVKDLSLNPSDCVIETPFGSIDASLGQQHEALRENLTYILGNR